MTAVWMRVATDLRARWRSAVLLAVLLGLGGGIAMTAAAGARRTTTSYERLLRSSNAYDVEIQLTGDESSNLQPLAEIEARVFPGIIALPQVAEHGRIAFIPSTRASTGAPEPFVWDVTSVAVVDRNVGRTLEVPALLRGRNPDPDEPLEAAASEEFLRAHRVALGDEFALQLATYDELDALFGGAPVPPTGPVVRLRIVGVWRLPHDISIQEQTGLLFLTPSFYERFADEAAPLPSLLVRLHDGERDVAAFLDGARAFGREATISFETHETLVAKVDRALGVQSAALWALAAAVALVAVLVLGQAIGRWLMVASLDTPILHALGMTRLEQAAGSGMEAALIGLAGAAVAIATTVLATPAVPIGLARDLDPSLGIFLDAPVLAIGGAATLVTVALRGWIQGLVAARRSPGPSDDAKPRPSALADRLARSGAQPTMVTGVRFALEAGRGRTASPVRSVIAGTIVSIAAVVGALVFGLSMERMLTTPATYGWNWDLVVFGADDAAVGSGIEAQLHQVRHIAAFSRVTIQTTTFDGDEIEILAVAPVEGRVLPTMLEGRYPERDDEVALATTTLRSAGLRLGDRATFPGAEDICMPSPECALEYRVVGRLAFWSEGADPDRGAAFTPEGQAKLRTSEGFADYLVRLRAGSTPEAARAAIEDDLGIDVTAPRLPVNLMNVARARTVPLILAAILGGLALATIVHGLVMAARRRRHDLAVLKTLGFVRRQIRAAVAWQSTTTVAVSLAVGVPIGILLGRWTWALLADGLGIRLTWVAPVGYIAAGAALVIVLANLVAMVPARIAARARPAEILRTE